MIDPRILHIETATNICSVALSEGATLLAERERSEDRSHASLLTVFIEEVLNEAGIKSGDLHAISISKGPGSYTGLRIGVSVTKGLAYGLNIPVIGIVTLESLAAGALMHKEVTDLLDEYPESLLCPMLDARRMEVFSALYSPSLKKVRDVSAEILEKEPYKEILERHPIILFGNGAKKALKVMDHPGVHFFGSIQPSAKHMISLALKAYHHKSFENTAYFEPFYLKDFVATIPRKKVL